MKAFVSGGGGFLGIALVHRLLADGWEVTALRHEDTHGRLAATGATIVQGSITTPALWREALRDQDVLFHLASFVTFDPTQREAMRHINEEGTEALLATAAAEHVGAAVVVSSAITGGLTDTPQVVDETAIPEKNQPLQNPYMASKLGQEAVARAASDTGLRVVIVNPTTIFGPGDWKLNSGSFFRLAQNAKGIAFVPPGGTNVAHVEDIVDGILAAYAKGRSGERYLLTGENLTFQQIVRQVGLTMGRRFVIIPFPSVARPLFVAAAALYGAAKRMMGKPEWLLTPQIIGDTFRYKWFSSEKAEKELGYQPTRSFAQAADDAWAFYQEKDLL